MGKIVICPKCLEIRNWDDVLEDIESRGSPGMCMCEYMDTCIDDKGKEDVWFPRILNEYIDLSTYIKDGRYKVVPFNEGEHNDK